MQRLSNDELATRTREANRRRGERHRERLTIAGRAALTVWVPVGLRSRFVNEAAASGVNINELATRLIEKGLRESQLVNFTSSDPQPDTADMFATADSEYRTRPDNECPVCGELTSNPHAPDCDYRGTQQPQTPVVVAREPVTTQQPVSVSLDRSAMMTTIGELLDAGLTGNEIARRLNAAGYRSTKGSALIGANVLREYRAWKEKKDGSDSTAV